MYKRQALAQAQHKVKQLADALEERGAEVDYAIPVSYTHLDVYKRQHEDRRKRFRPRRHSRADIPASGVPGRMAAGVLS